MPADFRFKQGDTFDRSGTIEVIDVDANQVTDLTGWTGDSHIRTVNGVIIADLDFEWIDASQRMLRLSFVGSTLNWEIGNDHLIDIQLTDPAGHKVSTNSQTVEIYRGATR